MSYNYLILSLILSFIFICLPVFAIYEDWDYKIPITINNTQNSETLIDYQIFINISYLSEMKSDFSDLRFSFQNISGEFEIPYWIENQENDSYAEIWVKIPKIRNNEYEIVYVYPEFNYTAKNESITGISYYKTISGMDGVIKSDFENSRPTVSFSGRDFDFKIQTNGEESIIIFSKMDYQLVVLRESGLLSYRIKTKEGEYIYEKIAGSEKEICKGNCDSAREFLSPAISEVSVLSEYVMSII